jgi:hypothetical protein
MRDVPFVAWEKIDACIDDFANVLFDGVVRTLRLASWRFSGSTGEGSNGDDEATASVRALSNI